MNREYDFTEIPNGPFPIGFGFVSLNDPNGVATVSSELDAPTYYYVENDKAVFNFTEEISPSIWRGVLCTPGTLVDKQVELSVFFHDPFPFFSSSLEEFRLRIGLGYWNEEGLLKWTGGLLDTFWDGDWNPELSLSVVSAEGNSFTPQQIIQGDRSYYHSINSFTVRVTEEIIEVVFNEVHKVSTSPAFVSKREGQSIVLFVQAYKKDSGIITPLKLVYHISGKDNSPNPKLQMESVETGFVDPQIGWSTTLLLPLRRLSEEGKISKIGDDCWEFKKEVTNEGTDDNVKPFSAKIGDRIKVQGADIDLRTTPVTAMCRFIL